MRYYCDNQEVINKLILLRKNNKRYDKLIRTTDHDAIGALKIILPPNLKIGHVKDHTDRKTKENQLTIPEKLNIQADLLCGEKAQLPIQTHILNTPIAVYIGKTYFSNKYVQAIHNHCGEEDAKGFIKKKIKWTEKTMNLIDWEKSGRFIGKQTYATKKTLTKFVHGWLKLGNKNHGDKTIFPFCQVMEDDNTEHDHFLLCPASRSQKEVRLEAFDKLLTKLRLKT